MEIAPRIGTDIPKNILESTRLYALQTLMDESYKSFQNPLHVCDLYGLSYVCDIVYHIHKDLALWKNQDWSAQNYSPNEFVAEDEMSYAKDIRCLLDNWELLEDDEPTTFEHYGRKELLLCFRSYIGYLFNTIPQILQYTDLDERLNVNEHFNLYLLEEYNGSFTDLFDSVCDANDRVEKMLSTLSFVGCEEMCPWEVVCKPIEEYPNILAELGVSTPPVLRPKTTSILDKIKNVSADEFLAQCPDDICAICYDELKTVETVSVLPLCQHVLCSSCLLTSCERNWQCAVCRRAVSLFLNVRLDGNRIVVDELVVKNLPETEPFSISKELLIFT